MSFSILTVFFDPSDTCRVFFKEYTLLELSKVIQCMFATSNLKYRFNILINFQIHSSFLVEPLHETEIVSELSTINFHSFHTTLE